MSRHVTGNIAVSRKASEVKPVQEPHTVRPMTVRYLKEENDNGK
jgi:hypothetical protein